MALRTPLLSITTAVVLSIAAAACSSRSPSATVPSVTSPSTATTATTARGGASPTTDASPLAQGEAYSKCMRSNGVTSWPDPVPTPNGSYGYRTNGVDPKSASFQAASAACKSLLPDWFGGGQQLTAADQQAWLSWAKCVRSHGMPSFADPTFPGGSAVAIDTGGQAPSPQLQAAMDACKAQMPKTGGIGG